MFIQSNKMEMGGNKMTNGAMVSIIVPVYRVEREIERCIKSLINQTYQNIQILLIDDGSPDKCPEICDDFALHYENIKCYHKKNGGLSDARNMGLINAEGKYILFVDSDDYLELDACEKLIDVIENSDVDFVVGALREIRGDKMSYQRHSNVLEKREYKIKEFIIKSIIANEWYAPAVLNLYKRDFLIDNNLFFVKDRIYEDIEMLPRVYLAAKKVAYLDYAFYNYILRDNSIMTSSKDERKIKSSIENYSSWKEQFDLVEDKELRSVLYGALLKYYLKSSRAMKIYKWEIKDVDFRFAIKYGLNIKEKIKIFCFSVFPKIYIKM